MPESKLPHLLQFRKNIKNFPKTNLPDATKKVHEDIKNFSKEKLQKLPVHFASLNYEYRNAFIPYHGYLVSGKENPKTAHDKGKIYWFVVDIMRMPYEVTPAIVEHVNMLDIPDNLKKAVQEFQGKTFATVEYFLREVMVRHAELDNAFITSFEVNFNLHYPGEALRKLVDLNRYINKNVGSYAPKSVVTEEPEEDLSDYWKGATVYREVNVSPVSLMEALREQLAYYLYLDERLGIGKSVEESFKFERLLDLKEQQIKELTGKWVEHVEWPKNVYEANCNSASVSLFQYALNREQKKSTLTYQPLQSATIFTVAKNHRMYMHDPLLISECVDELNQYIKKRDSYGDNLWGRLFKQTKDIKISAAQKMIALLKQNKGAKNLNADEVAALNQGKLKRIVEKYPQSRKILDGWKKNVASDASLRSTTVP